MVHGPGAATGNHLPHRRILPRLQRGEVHRNAAPPQGLPCIAHHRQAALRQNVHLHQANRLHAVHVEVRGGIALGRGERRRQRVHRFTREHHAAGVHLRIPRRAVEAGGHFNRRPVRLLVQRQRVGFRIRAEQFDQPGPALGRGFIRHPTTAEAPREVLRELPHLPLRHTQHLGHLGKRAPRLERREPTDHRAVLRAILGKDQVHHVVLPVVRKIHVDVRQLVERHAVLVEEPPEVEVKADGAHVGDAQAVADQRVRRAAPRDPLDAVPPARLQDVPDDQEVFLVAHVGDDAQLLLGLRLVQPVSFSVTPS